MPRRLRLCAACALALAVRFCLPGHGQDTPSRSLGDAARQAQAQKDKGKNQDKGKPGAKKVFTNDDLVSGSGNESSGARPGAPGSLEAASASPAEQLGQIASLLDQLDSLDRATLAKNVLEGNDADFPGRSAWEQKLFAAKQVFVAREREIASKATQLDASGKGVQNPNDSGTKALSDRLDQLMKEAERSSETFQAVAAEGKELAGQAASQ